MGGPDKDKAPVAQASFATEQTPGEGAASHLSGKARRPDAERKDRAQDPETPQSQSAPQLTDAGPAPPKVAAPMSTMEVSDGTENAGGVPEKRAGDLPVVETARVKSPETIGSDIPAAAGADAGTSDREQTQVVAENSYGLQLIGFFNRKTLDKFAARKGLPARVYVIRGTYRRRPWYAIIHSLHPDYAVAEERRNCPDCRQIWRHSSPGYAPCGGGTKLEVVETGLEPSRVATEGSEIHRGHADLSAEQKTQTQVRKRPDQVTTQVAEVAAVSEGPDKGGKPAAPASSATGQTPGERAEGPLSAKTQRPGTEQKRDRAQDPAAPHSAPQLTAADSSTSSPPKIAAPMSTADGSDGAGNAGSVPEKKGGPPAMETLGVKNPEAIGSDVPAAAGADAGAADREKTHVVSENSYGLQLIGFFSRRTLDEFAYQKGLPARIYVIRETYRRRPWHTIIHSLHPDRAAAKEELSRLPAELAALGPLVRPLRKGTKLQVIETGAE